MHERIHVGGPETRGALTLLPLWTEHPETAAPYVTVVEAERVGGFTITEQAGGSVPELVVCNQGLFPLLLLEGETISGGLQHRTMNVTVLAAAAADTMIPVSCVESGRWGNATANRRGGRHTPLDLRRGKTASVNHARRNQGIRTSDQQAVWSSVNALQQRVGTVSPTSSFLDASASVSEPVDALTAGLRPLPGQRGLVVGIAGKVRALELFDRASTFAAYFDELVSSYALDALTSPAVSTSASTARKFVRHLRQTVLERSDAVGLGAELAADDTTMTVTGLEHDGLPVHLVAFAA